MKGLMKIIMLIVAIWIGYNIHAFQEERIIQPQYPFPEENKVKIFGYSPDPSQTDSTPFITASGKRIPIEKLYEGYYAAVSRDLYKRLRLRYGDRLVLLVEMEVEVQDLMGPKARDSVDLFWRSRKIAKGWGVKEGVILEVKRKR